MPFTKSFLNAYPVGCIYQSTVSTSPATLFGGTWTALDSVFLVAKGAAGTFSTPGATGGSETVTLTAAQSGLPAHTHTIKYSGSFTSGYSALSRNNAFESDASGMVGTSTAANAASAHSNLPPYKVVYMWERTA
jgi:microcystin-dependent protein